MQVLSNVHDLVDRLAVVPAQRGQAHAVLHGLAPAGCLAVQRLVRRVGGKLPACGHLRPGKGLVTGLQRVVHAVLLQHGAQAAALFRLHGQVHQHLPVAEHIAARAADGTVKTAVLQQRRGHAQVASGAQKQLVPVGPGRPQRLQGAVRDEHIPRRQQGAVNVQKDQLTVHASSFIRIEPRSTTL